MSETVKPGQVWADNDRRSRGRTLRVESVWKAAHSSHHYATCTVLTDGPNPIRSNVGKVVQVRLDRFRPTSTGYRLLSEPTTEAREETTDGAE